MIHLYWIICRNRQERLTVPVYLHLNHFPSPDLPVGRLELAKLLLELQESLAAYLSPMALLLGMWKLDEV